jgi:hypothetical protein
LKKVDATTEDLRKHIAIDNDCDEKDIVFLRISEQKGNGIYDVCVKGKSMKYKRMGSVFMKNSENPFDTGKVISIAIPQKETKICNYGN